jgi:hypothetical protein
MDVGSLVSTLLAAQVAQMQLAAAAKIAKMQTDNNNSVVKLVDAADQNAEQLSATAQGLGGNIDVSA